MHIIEQLSDDVPLFLLKLIYHTLHKNVANRELKTNSGRTCSKKYYKSCSKDSRKHMSYLGEAT